MVNISEQKCQYEYLVIWYAWKRQSFDPALIHASMNYNLSKVKNSCIYSSQFTVIFPYKYNKKVCKLLNAF